MTKTLLTAVYDYLRWIQVVLEVYRHNADKANTLVLYELYKLFLSVNTVSTLGHVQVVFKSVVSFHSRWPGKYRSKASLWIKTPVLPSTQCTLNSDHRTLDRRLVSLGFLRRRDTDDICIIQNRIPQLTICFYFLVSVALHPSSEMFSFRRVGSHPSAIMELEHF